MHEIGVVIRVVKKVEDFAKKNGVTKIEALVLQIGALSSVIPRFVEECYLMAVKDTMLEDTKLKIEVSPANARWLACEERLDSLEHKGFWPGCNCEKKEMISGNEVMIKEIVAC